ncbi:MAG TPA: hypothetical protein VNZ52_08525, partial [Candidatus Thermoplasmatota archaeon]|nr:hypothetical protein [Candidatus Thermoplasmatota archaeon]
DLRLGAVFLMWFMFVVTGLYPSYAEWRGQPLGNEELPRLTAEMFGTAAGANAANWLAPFEVLSILLLAALIAAIVLALREGSD